MTNIAVPNVYKKRVDAVIAAGHYKSRSALLKDALRSLFEIKPYLNISASVELYKKGEVTLSKAAELAGITTIEFKDVLKDRGVKIEVPGESKEKIDKQIMGISSIRKKKKRLHRISEDYAYDEIVEGIERGDEVKRIKCDRNGKF
ncbi:MAG: hypothetical protein A7315_12380 [Candidatus Altiarchaeales archaeon WOR_SM1_79]|nr:MAG: hypothetical protein A7315_12380 [Candidatus Altiarchaeales archaeon WOR_SM1_79]